MTVIGPETDFVEYCVGIGFLSVGIGFLVLAVSIAWHLISSGGC